MCLRRSIGEDWKHLNKLYSIQLKTFAITITHHSHTSLNDLSNIRWVEDFPVFKDGPDYSLIPYITHALETNFHVRLCLDGLKFCKAFFDCLFKRHPQCYFLKLKRFWWPMSFIALFRVLELSKFEIYSLQSVFFFFLFSILGWFRIYQNSHLLINDRICNLSFSCIFSK